jgi:ABC-type microcin C transport system duplicated ATPase subunit YejF
MMRKLEKSLNDLVLKELSSERPIFIKVSPNVVKKAAMFLSGMVYRPVSIGVCGETASGKSTFTKDCLDQIIFYQNAKPKTLVCDFQKKHLLSAPACKLTNSKCIYF